MRNLLQGDFETNRQTGDIELLLLRYSQECTGPRNEAWSARFDEVKNAGPNLRRGYNSYNETLARWLSDQRRNLGSLDLLKRKLISTITY